MPRQLSSFSLALLAYLDHPGGRTLHEVVSTHAQDKSQKATYDTLYRLQAGGLAEVARGRYQVTPGDLG